MNLPKEATVFGVKVKWQSCIKCGQQVFTASPKDEALCGYCDREETTTPEYKKAKIPDSIRWAVWERDNFTCQHCGSRRNLTVDHIHPESKGGELTVENTQTLCRTCNSRKGAR